MKPVIAWQHSQLLAIPAGTPTDQCIVCTMLRESLNTANSGLGHRQRCIWTVPRSTTQRWHRLQLTTEGSLVVFKTYGTCLQCATSLGSLRTVVTATETIVRACISCIMYVSGYQLAQGSIKHEQKHARRPHHQNHFCDHVSQQ